MVKTERKRGESSSVSSGKGKKVKTLHKNLIVATSEHLFSIRLRDDEPCISWAAEKLPYVHMGLVKFHDKIILVGGESVEDLNKESSQIFEVNFDDDSPQIKPMELKFMRMAKSKPIVQTFGGNLYVLHSNSMGQDRTWFQESDNFFEVYDGQKWESLAIPFRDQCVEPFETYAINRYYRIGNKLFVDVCSMYQRKFYFYNFRTNVWKEDRHSLWCTGYSADGMAVHIVGIDRNKTSVLLWVREGEMYAEPNIFVFLLSETEEEVRLSAYQDVDKIFDGIVPADRKTFGALCYFFELGNDEICGIWHAYEYVLDPGEENEVSKTFMGISIFTLELVVDLPLPLPLDEDDNFFERKKDFLHVIVKRQIKVDTTSYGLSLLAGATYL